MVWGNIFNSARFHGISAHCSLWKPNGKLDKPNLSSSQLPCDPQRSSNPACGMSWNRKLLLPSHVSFPGGISVCIVTKGNLYELPYRLVLFDSPPKWVPSTLPKTNSQRHLKIGRKAPKGKFIVFQVYPFLTQPSWTLKKKFERLIFPTKYGIPKSSSLVSHWLSK